MRKCWGRALSTQSILFVTKGVNNPTRAHLGWTEAALVREMNDETQFMGKDAVDITQFMCLRSLE